MEEYFETTESRGGGIVGSAAGLFFWFLSLVVQKKFFFLTVVPFFQHIFLEIYGKNGYYFPKKFLLSLT